MYAIKAWPNGGFSEMVVSVHETETDAWLARIDLELRYPAWRFQICEVAA